MKRYGTAISLCLAGLMFVMAGTIQTPLVKARESARPIVLAQNATLSPLMAFLPVALGGFRGIMADALWLRLTILQDEGSYIEIIQLANWITALIPNASEIWSFQAWNMSFNVAAAMNDNEERWQWVLRGLNLLTDEAMKRSPDRTAIEWEIGHIYQHKIASSFDRAHAYYQKRLAESVAALIPEGRLSSFDPTPQSTSVIQKQFGMDLTSMRRVDALYGPLDWRLAPSHAIYWATVGSDTATGEYVLNCDRMVYQNLADLFRRGRLPDGPVTTPMVTTPDFGKFSACQKAYEAAIRRHHASDTSDAYLGFLKTAVRLFHSATKEEDAQKAFSDLVRLFPDKTQGLTFEQVTQQDVKAPKE